MKKETFQNLMEDGIEKIIDTKFLPEEIGKKLEDYIEFKYLLKSESDRGAALFAASYIDFLLEKVLRVKMIGTRKHLDSLFNFSGPLGTFSSRTSICFSIGIIPKDYYNEINIVRKIRNIFGHSPEKLDFNSEKINDLIEKLKFVSKDSPKPNRIKFNRSLSFLIGGLEGVSGLEKKFEDTRKKEFDEIYDSIRKMGL